MKYRKRNHQKIREEKTSTTQNITLSQTDRITYIFKYFKLRNKKVRVYEVTNVSYEILIKKRWITIVHYDSSHGFLHRHIRISLKDESETITTSNVKRKGDPGSWLKWAISDLSIKHTYYRKQFMSRSNF